MTEHESENMYEELRRKLADYGSHPSEEVWAGIQQQLPPPPLQPVLRTGTRQRRHGAMLLSALLLLLAGISAYFWRHHSNPLPNAAAHKRVAPETGLTELQTASVPVSGSSNAATQKADGNSKYEHPQHLTGHNSPVSKVQITTPEMAEAASPASVQRSSLAVAAPLAAGVAGTSTTSSTRIFSRGPYVVSKAAAGSSFVPKDLTEKTNGRAGLPHSEETRRAHSAMRVQRSTHSTTLTGELTTSSGQPSLATAVLPQATGHQPAQAPVPTPRPEVHDTAGATSVGMGNSKDTSRASQPTASSLAASAVPTSKPSEKTVCSGETALASGVVTQTPGLRPLPLILPFYPVPAQSQSSEKPVVASSPWSFTLLAGPLVSYRRFQAGTDSAALASTQNLEHPALGYSVQLTAAYRLKSGLAVSSGIGFMEHATQLNYTLQQSVFRRDTSIRLIGNSYYKVYSDSLTGYTKKSVAQRNTYRLLQIPLFLNYQLATASRFSFSLISGGTLGLYVGGNTTEGSACAATQKAWHGAASSPFRLASVALMAGAQLDYSLGQHWHLLVQPTLHYTFTSISRTTGRYPIAAGLQTGLSFQLP